MVDDVVNQRHIALEVVMSMATLGSIDHAVYESTGFAHDFRTGLTVGELNGSVGKGIIGRERKWTQL